jgi:hypothetical protein
VKHRACSCNASAAGSRSAAAAHWHACSGLPTFPTRGVTCYTQINGLVTEGLDPELRFLLIAVSLLQAMRLTRVYEVRPCAPPISPLALGPRVRLG